MRHPISWSALADASVGVWGLGVEGQASIRRLRAMGRVPVLVDDMPATAALDELEVLATERGGLAALGRCDVVVKSPGISRYRPDVAQLEDAGVVVSGGLGLFMAEADPSRVACITGTKGKSTTTALAVHLLRGLGVDGRAGGNIGVPPWDPEGGPAPEYWIIETSSFQVPDLLNGPSVVAVTSLSPDHLDWHGSVARYYADKLSLCTKPGVTLALADGSDAELRAHTGLLGPHVRWVGGDAEGGDGWTAALGLTGPHNARNAAMARAVLQGLGVRGASDDERLAAIAPGFDGLPSRCRSLGTVGGAVEFVDDGLSTNVLPARAALQAFAGRPVALLVGGHERGLDYEPLGRAIAARTEPTLVVTMPDNGPRIGAAIRAVTGGQVDVRDAADLEAAVVTAFEWAPDGGVVLLSPAAPSFGRFADYRERSAAFAAAAGRLGTLS
jgi:UDP-N-acetylmuramoyl-L-alanine---L-glutamate ligase